MLSTPRPSEYRRACHISLRCTISEKNLSCCRSSATISDWLLRVAIPQLLKEFSDDARQLVLEKARWCQKAGPGDQAAGNAGQAPARLRRAGGPDRPVGDGVCPV